MKVHLREDEERDKITTVQIELGLSEYQVFRKLLKMGITSDDAEKLERSERQLSSRFVGSLFDADEGVKVAIDHVQKDVPVEYKSFYLDPHAHKDEELMVAGIMKPPEDRIVQEVEGEQEEQEDK